jgi:hypothetical protein
MTSNASKASTRLRWLGLSALVALGVTLVEYGLNTLFSPLVDWSPSGVAAHMALDLAVLLPLAALAIWAGSGLARRLGLERTDSAGLLGTVGVIAIAFFVLVLPITSTRDLAHEWFGTTYGFSLAEVQTTVVTSELTVQEATQLCSFTSLRSQGSADGFPIASRIATGVREALIQVAALMPILLIALLAGARRSRWSLAPAIELGRVVFKPMRLALVVGGLGAVIALGGLGGADVEGSLPPLAGVPFNACTDGGPVKEYNVSAIDITMTLNRWGDHVVGAHMYALDANIDAIRQFEADLEADRLADEGLDVARVSHGLRKDLIQPLVIRANLGDCLRINFTNALDDEDPASLHILGLPHTVDSAGSSVGENPDTMVPPGGSIQYNIPIPLSRNAERAYYFHDHGAGRRRQNMGLFGTIVAEPQGSIYYDVETGLELDTTTGSNWEAIIFDPNADDNPDGKSFREFVVMYHEIGNEAFTDLRDRRGKKIPLIDELTGGIYRPAARALNYRSEPFRNRIAQDKLSNGANEGNGKSLGYSSYPFGDPGTPIPRSYVGEGTKTRLMHGGSEVFHVHHLHGGGDRWRRNPNADPNNDYWKGLTKVPDPNLTSIHLDSQSIGPGTSYNLEHECGAGGCQQGVGDFLYHCHIGHHYLSGMWAFWRVFGTVQDEATNLYGRPLAVKDFLFQADNPFSDDEAPSNTPPEAPVSAGDLIGNLVDDGRMIVADADVVDPSTQIGILEWITNMLPPQGARLDNNDATVMDWISTGDGVTLQVWGEVESSEPFAGYVSTIPGQRPELLFNPKNARYQWPHVRPHVADRPPFSARHSGAPWLGEKMKEGRYDGLCAQNGVHPGVDVGDNVERYYPVSSITMPIQITSDSSDQDGMIFVLNEEEQQIRSGQKAAEPLVVRSNVGDCVEIMFTNKIPDGPLNKNFSKTNIHSHFVQFDTQASDGVITGFSYEQSVRPISSEDRQLTATANIGATSLSVNHTDRLRPGIWLGVGLGEGTCGLSAQGQPEPCTEVRKIVDIPDAQTIVLDEPLEKNHAAGQDVGVEFVRYKWYSDVDFGTVFFHTHVDFKDWDRGLFGAHIVEPKGSRYKDPTTGETVRAGTLVDVHVDQGAGGNPVAAGVPGSFREFVLFLHNNNPVEGPFSLGGGTVNLRAEPWRLRGGESAFRFSSVTHGDPHTQEIRAYPNDPIIIRGTGLVERVGGLRVTGHRFNQERYTSDSDTRDATFIGISERFDVSLEGGAGGPNGSPGDYLYYSTMGKDFESGAWGLLRVFGSPQGDLRPLPDFPARSRGNFPELSFTGGPPPSLAGGPGRSCPADAPKRAYSIVLTDTNIVYNEIMPVDDLGVAYVPKGQVRARTRTPMVMRVNAGECLRVTVENRRSVRGSLNVGELLFDPQRSYGAAIGLNFDSTIAPNDRRTYEYFADRELGLTLGLNLGDIDSVERGAYAGVVVEPAGSIYRRPGSMAPLPGGGIGIQADIVSGGATTREVVALFSDEDRRIGQNAMPYPEAVENFTGINYSAEPLNLRDIINRPADVFKSDVWGDPRHVVSVQAGTPLIYRVAQPWGNQTHLPSLEGHRFLLEPGMAGSEEAFNDVLVPGLTYNWPMVGGAGSDIAAPGDYLFLDRRQPFLEAGLWNILRVTEQPEAGRDQVRIKDIEMFSRDGSNWVSIRGLNGVLPAGDTASSVTIYEGGATAGRCTGEVLGRARVNIGSGKWRFEQAVPGAPSEVCISSAGGGIRTARL